MKKVLSILVAVIGAGLFLFGRSTAEQASQSEQTLNQVEQNLQSPHRPIVGPVRRHAHEQASSNAQEKIGEKQMQVGQTESSANWMQGTGIALFVIGLSSLLFSFSRKEND